MIVLACLVVTAVWMYTVRGQEEASLSAAEVIASREMIQILLEQRQQVRDEHVEMVRSATGQGGWWMGELFRSENDALRASLELAGDQEAEIAIRKKILENFRKIEEIVQMFRQNGVSRIQDLLLVKANRITAEVELAEARSKVTGQASPSKRHSRVRDRC